MNLRVIAVGQDTYWLAAVHHATANLVKPPSVRKRSVDGVKWISKLPRPNASTVLLLDASDHSDVEDVVSNLRSEGWKYVVVVAADQSARQATSVLRGNVGFDYWEKTYDEERIRNRITTCFNEILEEKRLKKRNATHNN